MKKGNKKINNKEKFELSVENEEENENDIQQESSEDNDKVLHNAEILWKQYDVFADYAKNRSKTFEKKTKGAIETIKQEKKDQWENVVQFRKSLNINDCIALNYEEFFLKFCELADDAVDYEETLNLLMKISIKILKHMRYLDAMLKEVELGECKPMSLDGICRV